MIELKQVTKTFDRALAVHSLDIIFRDGITSVLIGPSTSGKSTVIRLIMGLIQPDSGTIYFDGSPVSPEAVLPVRRRMGYVIQEGGRALPFIYHRRCAMIKMKRVYDPPSRDDGKRILIDRLWPRGLKKEEARVDEWIKDIAPSSELRKWFGHDPGKWNQFKHRFFKELQGKQDRIDRIAELARKGPVTLLFGSREEHFNNATALKEYIEAGMAASERKKAA